MKEKSGIKKYQTRSLSDIVINARTDLKYFAPPWLTDYSLNMLFANTGVGKSHFAFNLGLKIAEGGTWLGQQCTKAKVLYIDGEMGGDTWVRRLMEDMIVGKVEDNFNMMCPDNFKGFCIPTLANVDNHERWIETCKDYDVIIIDNYITCCMPTNSRMSDVDIFLTAKDLLATLKMMGKAVILVHHTNKGGVEQYGTVYKDFWMDIILRLKQFPSQHLDNGLTWEIKYIKDRHDYVGVGFEYVMDIIFTKDDVHTRMKNIDEERFALMKMWLDQYLLEEEIIDKLDISKGDFRYLKRKFKNERNNEDII